IDLERLNSGVDKGHSLTPSVGWYSMGTTIPASCSIDKLIEGIGTIGFLYRGPERANGRDALGAGGACLGDLCRVQAAQQVGRMRKVRQQRGCRFPAKGVHLRMRLRRQHRG